MKRLPPAVRLVSVAVVTVALFGCGSTRRQPDARLGTDLRLRNFAAVHGADVFRAELVEEDGASSSGRTRNVLFIDPSGQGRWLLPDNDHLIDERPISHTSSSMTEDDERPVAIAALVRPAAGDPDGHVLLIFDPTGRTVNTAAENVDDVLGVTLHPNQDFSILYEQPERKYVVATFAHGSLTKVRDTVVSVPELK